MKWPQEVTFVRHGLSGYNALKGKKNQSRLYQAFRREFKKNPTGFLTRQLAKEVAKRFSLGYGDYETPLDEAGTGDIIQVGSTMPSKLELPDVVICSPYLRTRQTLQFLIQGWPELGKVKTYFDPRVREKEHGLANLYNDWRVMQALHPDQYRLYKILGPYWYRYPQGESMQDVRNRIQSWTATLIREFAGQRVLVVTHHLTIISIRANFERLSPEGFIQIDEDDKPINAGVTIYIGDPDQGIDGRLVLADYNLKWY